MEKERSGIARQAQNDLKLDSRKESGLMSQKSGIDFMQNCDLPPPLKIFVGLDNAIALSVNTYDGCENDDGELLKALRLSQARAREAEKVAAGLIEEKERMLNAFMKDSFHLFAYRQWVRLLEFKVSKLQSQLVKKDISDSHRCSCEKHDDQKSLPERNVDDMAWAIALPLCLCIAAVGFAFGCRFL